MSYDLSGSIVSQSYQRLVQISPGDNRTLLNGSGSQPQTLNFITASATWVSASYIVGDGSNITNIQTSSITNFNTEVSRSVAASGFGNFTLNETNVVSSSEQLGLSTTDNVQFNDITSSDILATSISAQHISVNTLETVTLTYLTISFDYATGSNIFGDSHDDMHIFTGSIYFADNLIGNGSRLTNLTASQINNFATDVSKSAAESGFGNFTLDGTGVYSSSEQFLPITTESITNFDNEVSRSAAESGFGNFTLDGTGVYSSSEQFLPITTESIIDFNLEVSKSAVEYGFGNFSIGDLSDSGIISSSEQISNYNFYSSSYTFENAELTTIPSYSLCIISDSKALFANALSGSRTLGVLGIAKEDILVGEVGEFHLHGFIEIPNIVNGNIYYINTSSGEFTNTHPLYIDEYVRIIGYSSKDGLLDFRPDNSYILLGTGSSEGTELTSETLQAVLDSNQFVFNGIYTGSFTGSFDGNFVGDGFLLTNIPTNSIVDFNLEVSRSAANYGFGDFSIGDLNGNGIISSSDQIDDLGYYKSGSRIYIYDITASNLPTKNSEFTPLVIDSNGNIGIGLDYTVDTGDDNVDMVESTAPNKILVTAETGTKNIKEADSTIIFNGQSISGSGAILDSNIVSSSQQISDYSIFLEKIGDGVVSSSEQLGLASDDDVIFNSVTVNQIIAQEYIISSSVTYLTISFSSGSTIFGDTLDDKHQFTGSVYITNSLDVDGVISGIGTGITNILTSSIVNFDSHISNSIVNNGFKIYDVANGGGLELINLNQFALDFETLQPVGFIEVDLDDKFAFFNIDDGLHKTTTLQDMGKSLEVYFKDNLFVSYSMAFTGSFTGSFIGDFYGRFSGSIGTESIDNFFSHVSGVFSEIFDCDECLDGTGIISSSQQITDYGFISSSEQVDYEFITNVPIGIISDSAQITALGFTSLSCEDCLSGSGIISSSDQLTDVVKLDSETGYTTTLPYSFSGSFTGSIGTESIDNFEQEVSKSAALYGFGSGVDLSNTNIISSSDQISNYSFYSSSYTFLNAELETIPSYSLCIISDSKALFANALNEDTTVGVLAIAKEDVLTGQSGEFHLHGFIDIPNILNKQVYYITTESGEYSNTSPLYVDEYVRIIGYSPKDGVLDFRPDNSYILLGTGSAETDLTTDNLQTILNSEEFTFTGSYTGSFVGNGSGLYNIPTNSIVDFNLEVSRSAAEYGFGNFSIGDLNGNGIISSSDQIDDLGYYKSGSRLNIYDITASNLPSKTTEFTPLVIDSNGNIGIGTNYTADTGEEIVDMVSSTAPNKILVTAGTETKNIKEADSTINFNGQSISGSGAILDSNIVSSSQQISDYNIFLEKNGDGIVSSSEQLGLSPNDSVIFNSITANQIIAQEYIISSSVTYLTTSFSSGSTKFGDSLDDTHEFTGSVYITNSLDVDGIISGDASGLTNILTSSITDFSIHVSNSIVDNGFRIYDVVNGGGLELIDSNKFALDFETLQPVGFIEVDLDDKFAFFNVDDELHKTTTLQDMGKSLEVYFKDNLFVSYSMAFTGSFTGSFIGDFYGRFSGSIGTESIDDFYSHVSGVFSEIFDCSECLSGSGIISSSQQITDYGFISSSEQVNYNFIDNVPIGIISDSAQITALGFTSLSCEDCLSGSGIISSSDQLTDVVKLDSETGYTTTLSYVFTGSFSGSGYFDTLTVSGSSTFRNYGLGILDGETILSGTVKISGSIINSNIVSSSQQISNYSFYSSSYTFENGENETIPSYSLCIISDSKALFANALNVSRSLGVLGIAKEDISTGQLGQFHLHGFIEIPNIVNGNIYYINTSSGEFTNTHPLYTDEYVRIIGYSHKDGVLDFRPDNSYILLGTGSSNETSLTIEQLQTILTSSKFTFTGSYTGSFVGDGSELYNIPTNSIIDFNLEVSRSAVEYGFGNFNTNETNIISGTQQLLDLDFYKSGSRLNVYDITASNLPSKASEYTPLVIDENGNIGIGSDYTATTDVVKLDPVSGYTTTLPYVFTGSFSGSGYFDTLTVSGSSTFKNYGLAIFDGETILSGTVKISGSIINSNIVSSSQQIFELGYEISQSSQIQAGEIYTALSNGGISIIDTEIELDYNNLATVTTTLPISKISLRDETDGSHKSITIFNLAKVVEPYISQSILNSGSVISGSTQIDYTQIPNAPQNIIQDGDTTWLTGSFTGSFSGSGYFDTLTVSGSSTFKNYGLAIFDGETILSGTIAISGSIIDSNIVSSSNQILDYDLFLQKENSNVLSSSNIEIREDGIIVSKGNNFTNLFSNTKLLTIPANTYDSLHLNYNIKSSTGGSYRAGNVIFIWDLSSSRLTYTDTHTQDIGYPTNNVTFSASFDESNIDIYSNISGGNWKLKIGGMLL